MSRTFGRAYRHAYPWRGFCGCPCMNMEWATPMAKEELEEALEDYKAELESEMAFLEKRIKALKEKTE